MLFALIIAYLLPAEERVNSFVFAGRVLVYGVLIFWGVKFIATPMETNYVGGHFMHLINLPFHEAGHLVLDRKSTRLNSSHANISYAVFCLKKKKQKNITS